MAANIKVGDSVSVPGSMYGTLKYLGPVQGKKGIFAGVQLAQEFAARGKNSGDVEGKYYFRTSLPGSGIFLPAEKAEKRRSGTSIASASTTASNQGALNGFNQGGRTSSSLGGALPKPNFSQSVGPGSLVPTPATGLRAQSPALRHPVRRESLPRPSSPLRKPAAQTPAAGKLATPKARPSLGFSRSTIGAPGTAGIGLRSPSSTSALKSTTANKFGQSLNQSTRGVLATPGRNKTSGIFQKETSHADASDVGLGPESAFDEDEVDTNSPEQPADSTPTPTPAVTRNLKSNSIDAGESRMLKDQLAERDRQLEEQANSIVEMEKTLADLQHMIANGAAPLNAINEEEEDQLPKDVQALRAALRERNEKIKSLTAEFDHSRADFRSTIDALEMASNETERVYEKRVEDLLDEVRGYQERNEDVESVALQFRQLEELVQELEEGLEDARRGEAEARGEVEFLRGEVERSRSEMRRERERSRAGDRLNGVEPDGVNVAGEDIEELQQKVDQRDDEIRGLKAIIQSLNDSATSQSPDKNRTPRPNGYGHKHAKTKSTNTVVSIGDETAEHLQQQFRDLENLLDSGKFSEADIREEVQKIRKSVQFGAPGSKFNVPGLGISATRRNGDFQKHISTATSSTASTARPGSIRSSQSANSGRGYKSKVGGTEFVDAMSSPVKEEFEAIDLEKLPRHDLNKSHQVDDVSVSGKTDISSNAAGWCEICEEAGHDILTCNSMGFTSTSKGTALAQTGSTATTRPGSSLRLLNGKDVVREGLRVSRENPHPPPQTSMPPPPPPPPPSGPAMHEGEKDAMHRPAPLTTGARQASSANTSPTLGHHDHLSHEEPSRNPAPASAASQGGLVEGTGDQAGMLAGKDSGVINPEKWCAFCERDGHDSVDCPIEDAF